MQEVEVKILEVNPEELEKKLLEIGAVRKSDEILEEWLFDKKEWSVFRGRVRVRKSGKKVQLAYKETTKKSSEGNLEIEFEVPDSESALMFVEKMGVPLVRHQQKRRVHYELGELSIDIDFWPKIPPYVEIEGKDLTEIEGVVKKLGIVGRRVELDARQIYGEVYGIDIDKIKELVF